MSDTVIKVENVSKRYRIGVQEKADTFAGQLKNAITYPVRNFKRITQLKKFDDEYDHHVEKEIEYIRKVRMM